DFDQMFRVEPRPCHVEGLQHFRRKALESGKQASTTTLIQLDTDASSAQEAEDMKNTDSHKHEEGQPYFSWALTIFSWAPVFAGRQRTAGPPRAAWHRWEPPRLLPALLGDGPVCSLNCPGREVLEWTWPTSAAHCPRFTLAGPGTRCETRNSHVQEPAAVHLGGMPHEALSAATDGTAACIRRLTCEDDDTIHRQSFPKHTQARTQTCKLRDHDAFSSQSLISPWESQEESFRDLLEPTFSISGMGQFELADVVPFEAEAEHHPYIGSDGETASEAEIRGDDMKLVNWSLEGRSKPQSDCLATSASESEAPDIVIDVPDTCGSHGNGRFSSEEDIQEHEMLKTCNSERFDLAPSNVLGHKGDDVRSSLSLSPSQASNFEVVIDVPDRCAHREVAFDAAGCVSLGDVASEALDTRAPDLSARSALHRAAALGDVASIRQLLAAKAAVDGVSHGFTALHDAAHRGRAAAVAELLRSSASASPAGAEGATPLELAARAGHCEVVQLLAAAWPAEGKAALRPLQLAAQFGRREVLQLLLQLRRPHLRRQLAVIDAMRAL
ncbi:unnamed protein product, partial [Effrenium voratum]